jgi:CRP-like cAMP-binding protein
MPISVDELKNHRFFDEWIKDESNPKSLNELETLANNCDIETFEPKEPLTFVKKSNDKPCFYLIREGAFIIYFPTTLAVKVDFKKEFSEDRFLFAFRSKVHETIGEIELTEHLPRMRARCMLEKSETIAVPIEDFQIFIEKFPKMWRKFFMIQMKKLESARHYAEAIQLESRKTGACIAASLLAIANDLEEDENKNNVEIKLMWEEFLAYISEGTENNVREKLNGLRDKEKAIKYIERGQQGKGILAIEIDREKLRSIASNRIIAPKRKRKPKKKIR